MEVAESVLSDTTGRGIRKRIEFAEFPDRSELARGKTGCQFQPFGGITVFLGKREVQFLMEYLACRTTDDDVGRPACAGEGLQQPQRVGSATGTSDCHHYVEFGGHALVS